MKVYKPLLIATTDASIAFTVSCHCCGISWSRNSYFRQCPQRQQSDRRLLELPEYVYPVAGLSIGKPIVDMALKPRLPQEAVIHYNKYQDYSYQAIEDYDQNHDRLR